MANEGINLFAEDAADEGINLFAEGAAEGVNLFEEPPEEGLSLFPDVAKVSQIATALPRFDPSAPENADLSLGEFAGRQLASNALDVFRLGNQITGVSRALFGQGSLRAGASALKGTADALDSFWQESPTRPEWAKDTRLRDSFTFGDFTPTRWAEKLMYKGAAGLEHWANALDPYVSDKGVPKGVTDFAADTGTTLSLLGATAYSPTLGGILGGVMNRAEVEADARAKGASAEDTALAGDIANVVGLTEIVSPLAFFSKITDLPGGKELLKKMHDALPKGGLRDFVRTGQIATTAAAEGLQEAFQNTMNNLTASSFVGYDEERPWDENVNAAMAQGAGQGALVAALAQMMGIRLRGKVGETPEETKERVQQERERTVIADVGKYTEATSRMLQALPDTDMMPPKKFKKLMNKAEISQAERTLVGELMAVPGMTDAQGNVRIDAMRNGLQDALFGLRRQATTIYSDYGFQNGQMQFYRDAEAAGISMTNAAGGVLHPEAVPALTELRNRLAQEFAADPTIAEDNIDDLIRQPVFSEPGRQDTRVVREGGEDNDSLRHVIERAYPGVMLDGGTTRQRLYDHLNKILDPNFGSQKAGTWVFNAPFPTLGRSVHGGLATPNYYAHVRGYFNRRGNIFYSGENQTDLAKGFKMSTVDTAVDSAQRMQAFHEAQRDKVQGILNEIDDPAVYEDPARAGEVLARARAETGLPRGDMPTMRQRFADELRVQQKKVETNERVLEDLRNEAVNAKSIRRLGEQAILNRLAQENIKIAFENGASVVRFPLLGTQAAIEGWEDSQTLESFSEMKPEDANLRGSVPERVWPSGADKSKAKVSSRAQAHTKFINHVFKKYKKYHKGQTIDDITVKDGAGYEWIEIPVNEVIAGEMDYQYGFPGPIGQVISNGVQAMVEAMVGGGGRGGGLMRELGLGKGPRDEDFKSDMDKFGAARRLMLTVTQIVKENPHIPQLKVHQNNVIDFWNTKTEWTARGDEAIHKFLSLKGDQQDRLSRLMLDVTVKSVEEQRRLTPQEILDINNEPQHQVGIEGMEVYEEIDGYFRNFLDALYDVMVAERRHNFGDNEVAFRQSVRELDEEFEKMRNQNYFPLTRFGSHYVSVKATAPTQLDGRTYEAGDVIDLRTFEGPFARQQQKRFLGQMRREQESGRAILATAGRFTDEARYALALPPSALTMLRDKLDLTPEQKTMLADVVTQLSPSTSFLRHMVERKATPGFSMDALRGFAEYVQKSSNYLAREMHKIPLNENIRSFRDDIRVMASRGLDTTKRDEMLEYLGEHLEYLYDPGEEAAGLRAAAFTWFIGFVPKSAFVNLTQPLLVGYPYLAAKHGKAFTGDLKASLGLSKAYLNLFQDATQAVLAKASQDATKTLTDAGKDKPPLEPWVSELVSRGIIENFLDESFATEVAGVAEGELVSRLVPATGVGRFSRRAGRWAAWMFQNAEKLNRRVVFIADVRLAFARISQGRTWEQLTDTEREAVFQSGAEAVRSTMYEYARWNRPEFMRGQVKSTIFTFYMFIQNTLFFAAKEPGRARFFLMMALVAGMAGLPGVEDISKLLDAVLTSFPGLRKMLGLSEKPMTDLKEEAREFIAELTDRDTADMIMYGLGRKYGMGPLHLLQYLGAPIPETDISASLSLGSVIPAIPQLARGMAYGKDFSSVFKEAVTDAAGASYGIPLAMLQAVGDWHPDTFKRYERMMPTAVKNAMRAYQWWDDEAAVARNGDTIVPFDRHNPAHFAEIVAGTGGFQPTRLTRAQDLSWAQREHVAFYNARRTMLKQAFVQATEIDPDPAYEKRVMEAVRRYNSSAPRELRLTGAELRMAAVNKRIRLRLEDAGIPAQPRFIPELRRIEGIFPDTGSP